MANSRQAFMEKKAIATAGTTNVTFTPTFGCNTFQLRFITNNDAQLALSVQTEDEDEDLCHIDGSPFTLAEANTFDSNGELEVTVDTSNPSIKVTIAGVGAEATVKCKAYRSLDDVTNPSGYTTQS
tara:strand:+ start:17060 stop:17437 length:378 start_codon:yes stop_codon:yes gene_type:complete